ncbi:MAG: hypothetical protein U0U70_04705 [Chitinophagaceae bacterium]
MRARQFLIAMQTLPIVPIRAKQILLLLLTNLLFTCVPAQKNVSYKYEQEKGIQTIFGGRVVNARTAIYKKTTPTTFIFDSVKNTVKILKHTYKITSQTNCEYFLDAGNWTKISIVNLYDKENDVEMLFEGEGRIYRFYFKRNTWVNPFGCSW